MLVFLVAAGLVFFPSAAHADPFLTPLFLTLVTSFGLTGTVASIAAAALSAIVTTAIGLGITLLFAPKPPKAPPPENGAFVVQSPVPYRIYGYGTALLAGALVFKEEKAGVLGYVAVLNGHRVDAIRSVYLNDDLVTVPVIGGNRVFGTVTQGADGRYGPNAIALYTNLGDTPETAYSGIYGNFPDVWSSSHRGDGCASLAMTCAAVGSKDYQKIFPYGAPQPALIVDQYRVFDPRDGTQSASDPSTWKFSRNPALAILHYYCFSDYGSRRDYARAIAPVLSRWIDEANICDELIELKAGGTEKRYELGGWITTEQDRRPTLQTMLQSCDGWVCERGDGTIILTVGKYRTPTVTLTDDDIIGFFFQRNVATIDKINQVTAKYSSPENKYTTVETNALIDTDDQNARSGASKAAQLDLPWVQKTGQASRLLKREYWKNKLKRRGKLSLRLTGINAMYERWILVQSNSKPFLNNIVIENRKPTINLIAMAIEIEWMESGPQIDVYDPAVDESPPPLVPQRPSSVGLPIPSNVSVVAQQITDNAGNVSVILAVSWDTPTYNGSPRVLDYLVQYKVHDIGGGVQGAPVNFSFQQPDTSGSRISVNTGVVPPGSLLDVQVFSVATAASLSTGSTVVQVNTAVTVSAPGAPANLVATGGTLQVNLACTNPNSANFSNIQFYRGVDTIFANASTFGGAVYGSPNGTTNMTFSCDAGTYQFWAVARSATGSSSMPVGPVTATIDASGGG